MKDVIIEIAHSDFDHIFVGIHSRTYVYRQGRSIQMWVSYGRTEDCGSLCDSLV